MYYVLEMRTPGHILQILKCGERLIEAADKTQRVGFFSHEVRFCPNGGIFVLT